MHAQNRAAFVGLAVIVALTVGLIVWPLPSGQSPQIGADTAARPSAERVPFEWHDAPKPLPDLVFTTADGGTVTLADFRGQMVLINLWATWCAPCLREMPMLDRLAQAAEGPGFALIALNQDRGGLEVAAPYWDDKDFTALTLYLDNGLATGRALQPTGLPLTVLIDRDGQEIARLAGIASWDHPAVIAYFNALAASEG